MKTFKALREKWIASYKGYKFYKDGKMDIFLNPTMKELKDFGRKYNNDDYPRGFIAPNGKVYIASDGIHGMILGNLKSEISMKYSIPIIIDYDTRPVKIHLGDYIFNTDWHNKKEEAAKIITNNRWVKKTFRNVIVVDDYDMVIET